MMARKFRNTSIGVNQIWDLWLSEQHCQDPSRIDEEGRVCFANDICWAYQLLIRDVQFKSAYERLLGKERKTAILMGHGGEVYGEWRWQDHPDSSASYSYFPVQQWVDEIDGLGYNVATVAVCNAENSPIGSRKTPLI
jgi:hypothetical protein